MTDQHKYGTHRPDGTETEQTKKAREAKALIEAYEKKVADEKKLNRSYQPMDDASAAANSKRGRDAAAAEKFADAERRRKNEADMYAGKAPAGEAAIEKAAEDYMPEDKYKSTDTAAPDDDVLATTLAEPEGVPYADQYATEVWGRKSLEFRDYYLQRGYTEEEARKKADAEATKWYVEAASHEVQRAKTEGYSDEETRAAIDNAR
jgi:hypothetical protein